MDSSLFGGGTGRSSMDVEWILTGRWQPEFVAMAHKDCTCVVSDGPSIQNYILPLEVASRFNWKGQHW